MTQPGRPVEREERAGPSAAPGERFTAVERPRRPHGSEEAGEAEPRTRPPTLSLVIPAYNEEGAIAKTLREARRILRESGVESEIIVVDDGSTDRTAAIAALEGAQVVQSLMNRGYGNALRLGILEARYDCIAICDADGTYPIDRLPDLLAEYDKGYDLVIGSRTGKHFHGSLVKAVARRIFHRMCESATGSRIPDGNSGLRVFSRDAILPYLPMMCSGFSFTTSQTLCFLSQNREVGFVPVSYSFRIGTSKVRHLADSLRTAQYIFQFYTIFNPVKLFTTLAFVPFLAGVAVLLVALAGAAAGALSALWPPVFLAALCFGVSMVVWSLGLAVWGVSRQQWPYPRAVRDPVEG